MRTALLNNPYTDSRMLEIERVLARERALVNAVYSCV